MNTIQQITKEKKNYYIYSNPKIPHNSVEYYIYETKSDKNEKVYYCEIIKNVLTLSASPRYNCIRELGFIIENNKIICLGNVSRENQVFNDSIIHSVIFTYKDNKLVNNGMDGKLFDHYQSLLE